MAKVVLTQLAAAEHPADETPPGERKRAGGPSAEAADGWRARLRKGGAVSAPATAAVAGRARDSRSPRADYQPVSAPAAGWEG